jgi:hypothetical protein
MPDVSFREVQRYRQKWLWMLVLPPMLILIGLFAYGMITQLALDRPFGDEPMSDTALAIVGSLAILAALLIPFSLYAMKLVTEVRSDGVHVRLFPFAHRKIPFETIKVCEARSYSPLMEYGGWGVRWNPRKGMAYNVSGNQGVQLELSNRRRVLIGSQRPEELAQAIQKWLHCGQGSV